MKIVLLFKLFLWLVSALSMALSYLFVSRRIKACLRTFARKLRSK